MGASVGARVAENDWRTTDVLPTITRIVPINPSEQTSASVAARFGGYAGYNWQFAPRWVAGVEGYGGFANNSQAFNPMPGAVVARFGSPLEDPPSGAVKESWDAGIRARLGYLVRSDLLVFMTGGTNWMSAELQGRCAALHPPASFCSVDEGTNFSKVMIGWTVGAGFEYQMTEHWSARLDYQYADFGNFSQTLLTAGRNAIFEYDDRVTANVAIHTHTATVGVGYKF